MTVETPVVAIIMGSPSDWDAMRNAAQTLKNLGIPFEAKALSAHRNAEQLAEYVKDLKARGFKAVIAGAGMAAALPGVVAAMTSLPVLGVPMETRVMGGIDSLLSIVQMPRGIPVGTFAIGKAGAMNAALFAAAILALSDAQVSEALEAFRAKQSATVAELPDDLD